MKILTAEEMGAVDRRTVEEFGVPLGELMEAAGGAVAAFCLRRYPAVRRATVLCGKGNNGGDGFVAARVLAGSGLVVRVVLLGRMDEVKGEAAMALRRLRDEAPAVAVREVEDEAGLKACSDVLGDAELLIDAVVGTGFKPPLRGLAAALREMVEGLSVPVVAVDVPSGWDSDSMEQTVEGAYRADAVVTFTAPKMAHVFGHLTRETFGPVVVAGIGSPVEAICSESGLTLGGSFKGDCGEASEYQLEQGKVRACDGGGWMLREGRGSGDGFAGCAEDGSGAGNGGGAGQYCGPGGRDCAGVDDGTAGGRGGRGVLVSPSGGAEAREAAGEDDGAGGRARALD